MTFKRARSTNSDTADLNAFPVSVLVSVGFSLYFVGVRSAARSESCRDSIDTEDFRLVTFWCATLRNDLVGINSEVSYQLDHAPTGSSHSNCTYVGNRNEVHQTVVARVARSESASFLGQKSIVRRRPSFTLTLTSHPKTDFSPVQKLNIWPTLASGLAKQVRYASA